MQDFDELKETESAVHRGHSGGTAALCQQAEQVRRATDDVHRGRYLGRRVALALDLWPLATALDLWSLATERTQEGTQESRGKKKPRTLRVSESNAKRV